MEMTIHNTQGIRAWIHLQAVVVHTLFWLLYVASEYFANMMHWQLAKNGQFFGSTFLSLPILILPTYFIAMFAVPRYLKTSQWPAFLFWVLVAALFVFFARIKWMEWVNYLEFNEHYQMPPSKALKNIIRDYSIIALAVCIYIIGDYRQKQQLNERLYKAKAEAEIKLLKGQLHPHFLFNSLNNIYSLALVKSDLTADSILKLTELLDYLVYRAGMEKVPLAKEVELLENYTGLEQLRYGEKLKIEQDIALKNDAVQVAPLILLPFAENCFKHGGAGKDGLFRVNISLRADDQQLVFQIANSKKKGRGQATVSGGVGLQNIRQRLELLYPGNHRLSIDDGTENYQVRLEIRFRDEKV